MAGTLTARQQAFVREYLVDLNATQAAVRAGYSPKTAEVQGSRLLRFVQVAAAIDEALKARAARVEASADDVLRELTRLALVDVGEAFDAEGRLLPLASMPAEVRRAIVSMETGALGVVKVRFADKVKSLELLGKHHKLFVDKVEHSGGVSVNVTNPYAGVGTSRPE